MRSTTRSIAILFAAGCLVAACGAAGPSATTAPVVTAPPVTATGPAPSPASAPTATPVAMTDGQGPEHFTGTSSSTPTLAVQYTETTVGDFNQIRGGVATWSFTTNDARMGGQARWQFSIDAYGTVGPEWGPLEIKDAAGSWAGPCSAASWASGDRVTSGCWLVGSGAYQGLTAYFSWYNTANDKTGIEGVIYPGPAPKL